MAENNSSRGVSEKFDYNPSLTQQEWGARIRFPAETQVSRYDQVGVEIATPHFEDQESVVVEGVAIDGPGIYLNQSFLDRNGFTNTQCVWINTEIIEENVAEGPLNNNGMEKGEAYCDVRQSGQSQVNTLQEATDELTGVDGIGDRTASRLEQKGFDSADDLQQATDTELRSVPGIGQATLSRIRDDL